MPRKILALLTLGAWLFLGSVNCWALAVKWSQEPNIDGRYWKSILDSTGGADSSVTTNDWQSADSRPVVAVTWWGTYGNQNEQALDRWFRLAFHSNVPAGETPPEPALPFSHPHPDDLATFNLLARETFVGWDVNQPTPTTVFKYEAFLPVPFPQAPGEIYWLDILYDNDGVRNPWWPSWHRMEALEGQLGDSLSRPLPSGEWNPVDSFNHSDVSFVLYTNAPPVPLPGTAILFGMGLLTLTAARRWS